MDNQPGNDLNAVIQHIRNGNPLAVDAGLTRLKNLRPLSDDDYDTLIVEARELNIKNSLVNGWQKPALTITRTLLCMGCIDSSPIPYHMKYGFNVALGLIAIKDLVHEIPAAVKATYAASQTPVAARKKGIQAADAIGHLLLKHIPEN